MGSLVEATCKCGFNREMLLGGGQRNFQTYCGLPYVCGSCKTFFVANVLEKSVVCPDCNSSNVKSYGEHRAESSRWRLPWRKAAQDEKIVFSSFSGNRGLTFVLTAGNHTCPSCGDNSLRFVDAGCWD